MSGTACCPGYRRKVLIAYFLVSAFMLVACGCRPARAPVASPPAVEKPGAADTETPAGDPSASPGAEGDTSPAGVASAELGGQLYARHCGACHGERGDGNGLAARFVFPKPRDFRAGRFRLVSTSNTIPSRDDVHAVLLRGMPGSSMPPWGHLSQAQRDALVDEVLRMRREGAMDSYVQQLKQDDELTDEEIAAPEVQREIREFADRKTTPGESSVVPEISPSDEASLVRGKEVYAKNGCLQCHGETGKGDGVQKMVDDEKFPTAPRDFTAGIFKGGHDPASLYRRIAYGMPGTPMPGSSQMTPAQMIDVVHYVRSMSTEAQREAAVLKRQRIVAKAVAALPAEASGPAWEDMPATSLGMAPLWWRDDADPALQVQAVHDGKSIAVRLSWNDVTPDWHAAQGEAFEDAVAMELYRGQPEPFIGMGDPRWPVDVWFWDADRQAVVDIQDQYPNVVVDIYPFSEDQVTTAEFQRPGTQLANQPPVSMPAVASGNQITPGHAASGGSALAGGGPGSSTFRLPKSQLVAAHGDWQNGRWSVVMTRTLATQSGEDGIALEPGGEASVAFAIWDGSSQDRDGKKSITIWHDFVLEQ